MKKINEGNGTLNSAEFKAVIDRLSGKEPELDEVTNFLSENMTDQERERSDSTPHALGKGTLIRNF